jgi:hypothetical protein
MNSVQIFDRLQRAPLSEFGGWFSSCSTSAFRFETLSAYRVPTEVEALHRFIAGEARPSDFNRDWEEILTAASNRAAKFARVRYAGARDLTPYLRFEIEWGYRVSRTLGEDIRILRSSDLIQYETHVPILADYWLFDDAAAFLMNYDVIGRFLGVYRVPEDLVRGYVSLRDALVRDSISLDDFLVMER